MPGDAFGAPTGIRLSYAASEDLRTALAALDALANGDCRRLCRFSLLCCGAGTGGRRFPQACPQATASSPQRRRCVARAGLSQDGAGWLSQADESGPKQRILDQSAASGHGQKCGPCVIINQLLAFLTKNYARIVLSKCIADAFCNFSLPTVHYKRRLRQRTAKA